MKTQTLDRDARLEARRRIVAAANGHINRLGLTARRRLSMRQLPQAVFMVRQHRLVDAGTLDLAGFRPVRSR